MVTGRNTVYLQYVRQTLWTMAQEHVSTFTLADVAQWGGLKVTGNLRRQLHKAVADGVITYNDEYIRLGVRTLYFNFSKNVQKAAMRIHE